MGRSKSIKRRNIPDLNIFIWDDNDPIWEELRNESDRGLVLVAGAILDEQLELLLRRSVLQVSTDDRDRNSALKKLFSGRGPLESFYAKIEIAYITGGIDWQDYQDLTTIRDIRNVFAHYSRLSFTDPDILKEIEKFNARFAADEFRLEATLAAKSAAGMHEEAKRTASYLDHLRQRHASHTPREAFTDVVMNIKSTLHWRCLVVHPINTTIYELLLESSLAATSPHDS